MSESAAAAEHVMQWVYDLVVLDPYGGDFGRKVTESLLDGVLALVEVLVERQQQQQHEDATERHREAMTKMAVDVLLKCAEDAGDVAIRNMATAKLHALVLTRGASSARENGHLISRVAEIMEKRRGQEREAEEEEGVSLAPVMKALLEKSKDQLHISTQLPSLNLRQQRENEDFVAELLRYFDTEEWKYFQVEDN